MQNKKINFGLQINKENKISSFCNLSLQGILKNRNLKLSINSSQSAEVNFFDQKNEFFFNKNEEKVLNETFKIFNLGYKRNLNQQSNISYSLFSEQLEGKSENDLFFKLDYKNKIFNFVAGLKDNYDTFNKSIISLSKEMRFKNVFADFKLGIGQLFGKPPVTDHFMLGKDVKGYKNNSICPNNELGRSFIQVNTKIGLILKNIKLFLFSDFGFCSSQNNLINTFKSINYCISNKTYPQNMALSVGVGISAPFILSEKNLIGFVAFPLTTENNNEKMKVGLETEI